MTYWNKLKELGITLERNGKQTCPQCSHARSKKDEKCLSVSFKQDLIVWNCHNVGCDWSGSLSYNEASKKRYYKPIIPKGKNEKSALYNYWEKRGISRKIVDKFKIDILENNIITFPYFKNGELVNIKYRQNLGQGSKKIWNEKDNKNNLETEKVLFGMDLVRDSKVLGICEGEPDCLSFHEAGLNYFVSVPNGAKEKEMSWIDGCWEWLQQFDEYIIAGDNDSGGKIMIENLLNRLDKYKCKIISYYQYKDANEVLIKEGKEKLIECVEQSKSIENTNIINFYNEIDNIMMFYENGFTPGLSTGWPNIDKIFTIKPRYLMVITGYPSRGKSYFTNNLLLNLSELHGWKHLVASFESDKDIYYGEMASKYKQKFFLAEKKKNNSSGETNKGFTSEEYLNTSEFISDHFYLLDPDKIWTIEEVIKETEYAVRKYGINCLTIDPYSCLKKDFGKQRETDYISDILSTLKALARRLKILIIFVAHPAKVDSDKPPNLYNISGSSHWFNFADYGIVVHRHKDEQTGKYLNLTDVIIEKIKNKHIGDPGCGKVKVCIKDWRIIEYENYISKYPTSEQKRYNTKNKG